MRILDLAHNMIRLAGLEPDRDIAIEYTGIRPGEKLREELFSPGEMARPTAAKRILRAVREVPIDPDWVDQTLNSLEGLILAGDESDLSERVIEMITATDGEASPVITEA